MHLIIYWILSLKTLCMNPYKKGTSKPYYFLVIDTSLAPDNPLRSERIF